MTNETREAIAAIVWVIASGLVVAAVLMSGWEFRFDSNDRGIPERGVMCGPSGKVKLFIGPGDEVIWRYNQNLRCFEIAVLVPR